MNGLSFINNSVKENGGAISWWGDYGNVSSSSFINNSAKGDGGAIRGQGNYCNINGSYFINGNAYHGGAICWDGDYGTVINSSFINGNAYYGGAIYFKGNKYTVNNSNFVKNLAIEGGAINCDGDYGTVINSSFINNSAELYGGAILWNKLDGAIYGSIFLNNSAKLGSTIYTVTSLNISNSIFLNNTALSISLNIINFTNSNVTLIFAGYNTNFNAIHSNSDLYVVNLAYWGLNGVMNTGNTNIIYSPGKYYQAGIDLNVTIYDNENNLLLNKTFRTDDEGKVFVDLSNLPKSEYYNLSATLKNNNYYTSKSNNMIHDLKFDSNMVLNVENITYGDDVEINIDLFGANGIGLNGTVYVILNSEKEFDVNVLNGLGVLVLNDLFPGSYDVDVIYRGADEYKSVLNSTNFIVSKAVPMLVVSVDNVTYGDDVEINIDLFGVNGIGLNGTVYVILNGEKEFDVNVLNGLGVLVLNDPILGSYDVDVIYRGADEYKSVLNSTNFVVSKAVPMLVVSVDNVTYGDDVEINIDLFGANGIGLNGTVDINFNTLSLLKINKLFRTNYLFGSNNLKVNVIDGIGVYRYINPNGGFYNLHVNYDGDENYTSVNVNVKFAVNKIIPKLYLNSIVNGSSVKVFVNLTGINNIGLNCIVQIFVNGKQYSVNLVNGTGDILLNNLKKGEYNLNAIYSGDDNYLMVENSTSFIITKDENSFNNSTNDSTNNSTNTNNTDNYHSENRDDYNFALIPKTGNSITILLAVLCIFGFIVPRKK